jgi:hypothetical protein
MTKEQLQQLADIGYSDSEIEKEIEANKKEYPYKPVKPTLSSKHTAELAIQYANDLAKYELDLIQWDKEFKEVEEHNDKLDSLFEEYLEEKSGLLSLSGKEQSLVLDLYDELCYKRYGYEKHRDISTIVEFVNSIKQISNLNK